LLKAERFMLAQSLDDLLRHALRMPVQIGWSYGDRDFVTPIDAPELDRDGVLVLSQRLPVTVLLEAARRPILPEGDQAGGGSAALARGDHAAAGRCRCRSGSDLAHAGALQRIGTARIHGRARSRVAAPRRIAAVAQSAGERDVTSRDDADVCDPRSRAQWAELVVRFAPGESGVSGIPGLCVQRPSGGDLSERRPRRSRVLSVDERRDLTGELQAARR
jgi:hypothetical protein